MKIIISGIIDQNGNESTREFNEVTDYFLSVISEEPVATKKKKIGFRINGKSYSHSGLYPRELVKETRQGVDDLVSQLKKDNIIL